MPASDRLEARSYLHRGMEVVFRDETADPAAEVTFKHEGGIAEFLGKVVSERGKPTVPPQNGAPPGFRFDQYDADPQGDLGAFSYGCAANLMASTVFMPPASQPPFMNEVQVAATPACSYEAKHGDKEEEKDKDCDCVPLHL